MATAIVASAPSAADSVGVAKPPDMAPTTTAKMPISGITYSTSSRQASQPVCGAIGVGGARLGVSFARTMM